MDKEYYIKFVKKGRTYLVDGRAYDKTGMFRFVSKEKVRKAKKRVVDYSVSEKRIKTPDGVSSSSVAKQKTILDKTIINSDILSQSVKKAVMIAVDRGKRIAVKFKGKIHEIKTKTVNQLKSFLDFTDKINSAYFNSFKDIVGSPLFFIGYTEGRKGIIFDYENIMIGVDDEINDEFPDEVKSFKKTITNIFRKL